MSILCYHSVDPEWHSPLALTPDAFEEQAAWIARHLTVAPLSAVLKSLDRRGRPARSLTALTFDDGLEGVFEFAYPILREHSLPATVFLVAETLSPDGRPVDWVDTPPPFPLRTLSVDQVRDMHQAGIEFGSHSFSHFDLTTLTERECVEDLTRSRELLEDLLESPVSNLAYPRGRHNEAVRRAAERAGYLHALALPEYREVSGPFAVPRVGIYPGNGTTSLWLKTRGWYPAVRTSRLYRPARLLFRSLNR